MVLCVSVYLHVSAGHTVSVSLQLLRCVVCICLIIMAITSGSSWASQGVHGKVRTVLYILCCMGTQGCPNIITSLKVASARQRDWEKKWQWVIFNAGLGRISQIWNIQVRFHHYAKTKKKKHFMTCYQWNILIWVAIILLYRKKGFYAV